MLTVSEITDYCLLKKGSYWIGYTTRPSKSIAVLGGHKKLLSKERTIYIEFV